MRTQIRRSVFETNSSSTHSICIAKTDDFKRNNHVDFTLGEFGWEIETYSNADMKAAYLYTAIKHLGRLERFAQFDFVGKIKKILDKNNITYTFAEKCDNELHDWGYIDHVDELFDFVKDICSDEGKLLSYLFNPLSFVKTGNDNCECDVEIYVDYPYYSYYKGN